MTSQERRNQKTQNDKYSHEDPERLRKQNKTVNEKESAQIVEQQPKQPHQFILKSNCHLFSRYGCK